MVVFTTAQTRPGAGSISSWATVATRGSRCRARRTSRPSLGRGGVYDFGFVPAMMRLVISHLDIAPHFGALFTQIMFAPGALERPEREMIAAVAASAQDCFY